LHLVGARTVWDDWSKTSGKFDAADQDRVWASFHGAHKEGVVTIATIYAWAKERGWVPSVNAHEPQFREQKAAHHHLYALRLA
jgi:Primase C terminal 2 (PriCT-2)